MLILEIVQVANVYSGEEVSNKPPCIPSAKPSSSSLVLPSMIDNWDIWNGLSAGAL